MKSSWETVAAGLDQLFFSPMVSEESALDRSDTINSFLSQNGWSWDDVINEMAKEDATTGCESRTKS